VVSVYDIYSGNTNTTKDVRVNPPASRSAAVSRSSVLLEAASRSGDAMAVMSVSTASINTINAVDCSLPETISSCSDINRDVCSETPHTCGGCLQGYRGIVLYLYYLSPSEHVYSHKLFFSPSQTTFQPLSPSTTYQL
jgi:hypothetical protein